MLYIDKSDQKQSICQCNAGCLKTTGYLCMEYSLYSVYIYTDKSFLINLLQSHSNIKIKVPLSLALIKKNEFNISSIALRDGENISQYNAAYFSEAGKTDMNQPLHYTLDQGNSLDIRIGYFVLKEDMENIVGAVSDSDIQFSINE